MTCRPSEDKQSHREFFHCENQQAMGQEESHSEEMDLEKIQELCIIFMKECPSGALHLHEFKRIFGVPSSSAEESLYMETIFNSFDTNKVKHTTNLIRVRLSVWCVVKATLCYSQDNTLDFLEYVAALHLLLRGNLEDRLKWSFKMYDKDGNGKLDRQEVKRIIRVRASMSDICERVKSFYIVKMSMFHNTGPLKTDYVLVQ